MPNNFYEPASFSTLVPQSLLSKIWQSIPIPPAILAALLLGPLAILLTAQLLLIDASEYKDDESEQDNWMVPFQPVSWRVLESFFGIPKRSKVKYTKILDKLNACSSYLLDEPHMTEILKVIVHNLGENIPQMITFISTLIDLQPWEQFAQAQFISSSTTELNLTSLLRDMLGHASVPAIFGHALMEKYPDILHDMYDMDAGRSYLLRRLPPWIPWPGIVQAHMARFKVWQCLDEQQKVLDAMVKGEAVESAWGYLEDVSMLVLKRNAVFREHGIDIKERADITILSSLVGNPSLLLTWQIQYILAIPGLIDRIRTQIGPYANVTKPFIIGTISEAPKLVLNHEGLSKKCPLLRSTYLETLRLVDENWDVKKAAMEGVSTVKLDGMAFPGTFDPERFLATSSKEMEEPTLSAEIINSSLYKSNVFMERTCLSLVAGILMFWDISPANKSAGWEMPEKHKIGGIAVPASETRVKIRRRRFEWVE